jgi:3-hydroxyisobutyrate dehydrogenase-like beta-hydroxyacid dehydrogenase
MRVGIIGLGSIGRGVADCLVRASHDVVASDIRPGAFDGMQDVEAARSPCEAARGADVVVIAVLDDDQVRAVVGRADGILAAVPLPRALVLVSTVSLDTVAWLGEQASRSGVAVVDCGVSGGARALADSSIVAMVGGDEDALALTRPAIEAFASPVIHMGPLGAGMAAKLGRNLLTFASRVVAWESMRLATAAGIEPALFLEMIKACERWSRLTDWLDRDLGVGGRAFDPNSVSRSAAYAHKDLQAALHFGDTLGLDLPMARQARSLIEATLGLVPSGGPDDGSIG